MTRILDRLELLKNQPAGELNRVPGLLPGCLLRRKSLFRFDLRARSRLLFLYRLTFPAASHEWIIDARPENLFEVTPRASRIIDFQNRKFELGQKSFASRKLWFIVRCPDFHEAEGHPYGVDRRDRESTLGAS